MPKVRDTSSIENFLYTRARGGALRYYADFREFADVGGKKMALVPEGARLATSDRAVAIALATAQQAILQTARAAVAGATQSKRALLEVASEHLRQMAINEAATPAWIKQAQRHLEQACEFFGDQCDVATIRPMDVANYNAHLLTLKRRGRKLATGTIRQYLNSLSKLFKFAFSYGYRTDALNPVGALLYKPKIRRKKTLWYLPEEVWEMLEAIRAGVAVRADLALPSAVLYALVATYFYTGGRESEILGLTPSDLDFEGRTIRLVYNEHRRMKGDEGGPTERVVPMPSHLQEILREFMDGPHGPKGQLVFASPFVVGDRMITDFRKSLDRVPTPLRVASRDPKTGRIVPAKLRTRQMRHTFCTVRVQCTDGGRPISLWTVAQEMGHADIQMVQKVYTHLASKRVRGEEVDYRPGAR